MLPNRQCLLCNDIFTPTAKCQKYCVKEDVLHYAFYYRRRLKWYMVANKTQYPKVVKQRIKRRSRWIGKYKCAKGCKDCGYNQFSVALDFDHIDPNNKTLAVSKLLSSNLKKLMSEIRKCEVVCANCHRVRTEITHKIHTNQKRHNAQQKRNAAYSTY